MAADEPEKSEDIHDDGLSRAERISAAVVGAAGAGFGGAGIFLSDHQPGTMLIFVFGAVFLFMAIQGTPVLIINKDGAQLAARRRTRKLTKKAIESEDPKEAAALVEAARTVDPSLDHEPQFNYLSDNIANELRTYEAIRTAIQSLAATGAVQLPGGSTISFNPDRDPVTKQQHDALLTLPGKGTLIIEIKHIRSNARNRGATTILDRMIEYLKHDENSTALLVINVQPEVLRKAIEGTPFERRIEIIKWTNEADNVDLASAMRRLLGNY